MKRNIVVGVALWLMIGMANVGTGAVNPKKDQNPSQAGQSSIHFYDVAATEAHGEGKLVVDVNRHTFVFNGQDFEPSSPIALGARAAGGTDYAVFATGKATPSGNLHISGSWEADVAPEDVVAGLYVASGSYPLINGFHLFNDGWFVAKLACYYSTDGGVTWKESAHTDGITIEHYTYLPLRDYGIPEGALVREHAIVVGGKDRTAGEIFQFTQWACGLDYSQKYAGYYISGVTWNPTLSFQGTFNIVF